MQINVTYWPVLNIDLLDGMAAGKNQTCLIDRRESRSLLGELHQHDRVMSMRYGRNRSSGSGDINGLAKIPCVAWR